MMFLYHCLLNTLKIFIKLIGVFLKYIKSVNNNNNNNKDPSSKLLQNCIAMTRKRHGYSLSIF